MVLRNAEIQKSRNQGFQNLWNPELNQLVDAWAKGQIDKYFQKQGQIDNESMPYGAPEFPPSNHAATEPLRVYIRHKIRFQQRCGGRVGHFSCAPNASCSIDGAPPSRSSTTCRTCLFLLLRWRRHKKIIKQKFDFYFLFFVYCSFSLAYFLRAVLKFARPLLDEKGE